MLIRLIVSKFKLFAFCGRLFEAGHLLTFPTYRVSGYSRMDVLNQIRHLRIKLRARNFCSLQ